MSVHIIISVDNRNKVIKTNNEEAIILNFWKCNSSRIVTSARIDNEISVISLQTSVIEKETVQLE